MFLESGEKEKFTIPLPPIVSDPIYDKKAMSDLIISKLSHCSAPATGGKEVILLCDRVTKDDIQVRFFEERGDQLVWEAYGEFQPADVHKQVAVCFRTPRYFSTDIIQSVTVQVQLRRPSDGHTSEPRPFQFVPNAAVDCMSEPQFGRKRAKVDQLQSISRYYRDQGAFGTQPAPSSSSSGMLMAECRVPRLSSPASGLPSMITSSASTASPAGAQQSIDNVAGIQSTSTMPLQASIDSNDAFFGNTHASSGIGESFGYTPMFGKLAIKLEQNVDMSFYTQANSNISNSVSAASPQQQQSNQSTLQPQSLESTHMYGGRTSSFQASALSPIESGMDSALSPRTLNASTNPHINNSNQTNSSPTNNLMAPGLSPAMATGNALSPSMSGAQLCRPSPTQTNSMNCQSPVVGEAEQQITERMDSLDLDIDASDLISDINLNNMMIMMDSGNNITFNSSGNIKLEPGLDALLGATMMNPSSNDNSDHDSFGILGNLRMTHQQ